MPIPNWNAGVEIASLESGPGGRFLTKTEEWRRQKVLANFINAAGD